MSEDWKEAWGPVIEMIGVEFGGDQVPCADRVEASGIRRYIEPLEFDCPLHYDVDVARAHGHPDIIAPYTAAATFSMPPVWAPGMTAFSSAERDAQPRKIGGPALLPPGMPPISAHFATDVGIEYVRPVTVGDRLQRRGARLVACEPKETKVGRGAFLKIESTIVDETGEPVALVYSGLYAYNPHPKAAS